eukprot:TRINITY_DN23672_c0_g2_i1.p1 TRINITY_DN23672_c0_g2~~TRINITY_DN23672_c0_g2_i1.p1  ORF type:complete len:707 (-),score=122.39 TRINITY_DN23672_c0_g2_i1:85-2205(-)
MALQQKVVTHFDMWRHSCKGGRIHRVRGRRLFPAIGNLADCCGEGMRQSSSSSSKPRVATESRRSSGMVPSLLSLLSPDPREDTSESSRCNRRGPLRVRRQLLSEFRAAERDKALALLDRLRETGPLPLRDPRDYTLAAGALGWAHRWTEALGLLSEMAQVQLPSNLITFNAVLSAIEQGHRWDAALSLLMDACVHGLTPKTISANIVISACEKSGEWYRGLALFEDMLGRGMRHSLVSYTVAISCCGRGAKWQAAIALLQAADEKAVSLDTIAFNAAIAAADRRWPAALALLAELRRRAAVQRAAGTARGAQGDLSPQISTYGAAIAVCGRALQWLAAMRLMDEMRAYRLEPNHVCINAAIASCRRSRPDLAASLYEDMMHCGIQPNAVSCTSLLSTCLEHWERALSLLESALRRHVQTDIRLFNTAMMACSVAGGAWQQAVAVLDWASRHGVAADDEMHELLFDVLVEDAQWQFALEFLRSLRSRRSAAATGSAAHAPALAREAAVARACARAARWERAVELLASIERGLERLPPTELAKVAAKLHWQGALLILERAWRRAGNASAVGWDLYGSVALVLLHDGEEAGAHRLVHEAAEAELLPPEVSGHGVATAAPDAPCVIDLHGYNASTARLIARASLLRHLSKDSARDLVIITGQGKHSPAGEAVILPELLTMFRAELGIDVEKVPGNKGRIRIPLLSMMSR